MGFTNFEVVVEKAHRGKKCNSCPHDHRLVRERDAVTKVSNKPPNERRKENRNATHGRGALLLHVMNRTMILRAKDGLTLAEVVEESNQTPSAKK